MLKKYTYLLFLFIRNSLIQAVTYRTDFFVSLLTDSCSCLVRVLFVDFLFQHVTSVGSWSFDLFLVYFGCAFIMEGIYMFFFFNGHTRISLKILTGEMDYFFVKTSFRDFLSVVSLKQYRKRNQQSHLRLVLSDKGDKKSAADDLPETACNICIFTVLRSDIILFHILSHKLSELLVFAGWGVI